MMSGFMSFVLFTCGGSVIFVLGAMTGRAFAVWNQSDEDLRLREGARRGAKAMTEKQKEEFRSGSFIDADDDSR